MQRRCDPVSSQASEKAAFPPDIALRRGAIVLVHGAWVGEYCWGPILPDLQVSGRPVHAVSLAGHGIRSHLSSPEISLEDHVRDVVDLVVTLDLVDITLVAHSYGGRVISSAFAEVRDRVAHIVYLDAHAPLGSQVPADLASAEVDMLPFDRYQPTAADFGGDDAVAWFVDRAMPQSAKTIRTQPLVTLPDDLDKTFVFASNEADPQFAVYAEAAGRHPTWRRIDVDASHWLMVTHPHEVAAIILDPQSYESVSDTMVSDTVVSDTSNEPTERA